MTLDVDAVRARLQMPAEPEFSTDFFNTRASMLWYWNQYLPIDADRDHAYASPIHAVPSEAAGRLSHGGRPPG